MGCLRVLKAVQEDERQSEACSEETRSMEASKDIVGWNAIRQWKIC